MVASKLTGCTNLTTRLRVVSYPILLSVNIKCCGHSTSTVCTCTSLSLSSSLASFAFSSPFQAPQQIYSAYLAEPRTYGVTVRTIF